MFEFPITILFTLFAQNIFKTSRGPSLQLTPVVSKVLKTYLFADSVAFSLKLQLKDHPSSSIHHFFIISLL